MPTTHDTAERESARDYSFHHADWDRAVATFDDETEEPDEVVAIRGLE